MYENGFGCVWETDAVGLNHALFIKQFDLRLMDTFQQVCRADIENSNRCSLYYRLNREFVMASYLRYDDHNKIGHIKLEYFICCIVVNGNKV